MAVFPFVQDFAARTALIVGDVMLDHFYSGEASRISPEAPVPVLKLVEKQSMPGGAANSAANVAALGLNAHLVAPLGDDADGRALRALLDGIDNISLTACPDPRGTTVKSRYSAQGQQLLRIDAEDLAPLDDACAAELITAATKACAAADILILSDYAKGALTPAVCQALIKAARDRGVPSIVDPKGTDAARYRGATMITPNASELAAMCHRDTMTETELIAGAQDLIAAHQLQYVAVTRGKSGVMLVGAEGLLDHVPSFAQDVFDVSGAGDSFVAGLACATAAGQRVQNAVSFGNAVAGVAVSKSGTALVYPHEVERLIRERGRSDLSAVTSDYAELARITAGWRDDGHKVGFANGVFDLLHLGHLRVLKAARAACDKLVVAINSDASVKRLKGPERPVQTDAIRAEILSNLQDVDLVVIFEEDTPIDVIEASVPDVLVKGGDYKAEEVVGYPFITERGGQVLIVPTLQGQSTTGTIGKMRPDDG